jgi:ABC-type sugar transport system substrate-binding protein
MNASKKLRIGFAINDTRFAFWALMEQGAHEQADRSGIDLTVHSASSAEDQAAMMREFIDQYVDVLIVAPIRDQHPTFVAAVEAAQRAKIPIMTCESGYDLAPAYSRCDVRANLRAAAEKVARTLFDRLGGRGQVLHLAGTNSGPRSAGFQAVLESYPQIEVVEREVDWVREGAAEVVAAALREYPDLAGVFAHSDEMAMGAVQAIQAAGHPRAVLVTGIDAMPEALQAVHAGELAATVNLAPRRTGQLALEVAPRLRYGESLPQVIDTPFSLITSANLLSTALDELSILPKIIRALAESGTMQRRLQEEVINAQRQVIQELSSPLIPVSDSILVLPLIGNINAARAQQIMESLLERVAHLRTQILIIDITGVPVVDTGVAHYLVQATQAVQLLGAHPILVGVAPEVAQTVVQLGIDLSGIEVHSTLQVALEQAMRRLAATQRRQQRVAERH